MAEALQSITSGSGEYRGNSACGKLLTAAEVAARLHVPVSWVRKHGGSLPGLVRLGKYVRWSEGRLADFIAAGGAVDFS